MTQLIYTESGTILANKEQAQKHYCLVTSLANHGAGTSLDATDPNFLATLLSLGYAEYTPPPPAPPTQEQIIAQLTFVLERRYDEVAQVKRYDNRLTCALRAGYAGPFQTEGTTFALWMDDCNAEAYVIMAECQQGTRPIPTGAELLALMPVAPW